MLIFICNSVAFWNQINLNQSSKKAVDVCMEFIWMQLLPSILKIICPHTILLVLRSEDWSFNTTAEKNKTITYHTTVFLKSIVALDLTALYMVELNVQVPALLGMIILLVKKRMLKIRQIEKKEKKSLEKMKWWNNEQWGKDSCGQE